MRQCTYNNIVKPYNTEHILNSILYNKNVNKYFTDIKNYNRMLYFHSLNVAMLSMLVGTCLYDDIKELSELAIAALLHDYGKVFISKSIHEKQDALTCKERKIIEQHSILGFMKLKQESAFSENILNGILDHHERMDGSGYNFGKTSHYISSYAKIIMIADVFDAMISDREYRKHMEPCVVKEYLISKSGSDFDSYLTELFLKQINTYDYIAIKNNVINRIDVVKS